MFSPVEILIIVLLLALVVAGGFRSRARLWRPRGANPRENAILLLLFVILVLLLVGFIVRSVMPLGEGRHALFSDCRYIARRFPGVCPIRIRSSPVLHATLARHAGPAAAPQAPRVTPDQRKTSMESRELSPLPI